MFVFLFRYLVRRTVVRQDSTEESFRDSALGFSAARGEETDLRTQQIWRSLAIETWQGGLRREETGRRRFSCEIVGSVISQLIGSQNN